MNEKIAERSSVVYKWESKMETLKEQCSDYEENLGDLKSEHRSYQNSVDDLRARERQQNKTIRQQKEILEQLKLQCTEEECHSRAYQIPTESTKITRYR